MSTRIGIAVAIVLFLTPLNGVFAADFSSDNFTVKSPVIDTGGIVNSSSTSFRLSGGISQISIGTSSTGSFQVKSGFFYFSTLFEAATSTTFNFTAGGSTTLTNINGTTAVFSIPSNFYSENLRLQTYSYANSFFATSKPAPSGENFIGKTYDFNFYTASESSVTAVSKPITIVLSYTNADISGFDESAIAPYRWGASDSSWQLISGATVDAANNKVTFSTANFSSFALFAPPSSPQQPSGGGNWSEYIRSLERALIEPLIKELKPGISAFDLNGDSKVNLKDFSVFLALTALPAPNPADFNNDGKVDNKDFSGLLFAWTEKFLTFEGNGLANILPAPKESISAAPTGGLTAVIAKPEPAGTGQKAEQKVKPAPQVLTGFFAKAAALIKKAAGAVYNLFRSLIR